MTFGKSPGPYKSKLIPYKQLIKDAWYKERKTGKEIQKILSEKYNLNIPLSSLYEFIRVRRKRPDPHDLPPFMQLQEQQVKSPIQEEKTGTPISVAKEKTHNTKATTCKIGNPMPLTQEEKAILERMQKQTQYETYQEAVRLKMAKKKAQQP